LDAGEIIEQFLFLREIAGTGGTEHANSNIVFMGMGEPLLNFDSVAKAAAILTHKDCFALSARRITVSTAGIAAGIRRMADELPELRLALSLTTAREALRARLMPVGKTNPLASVRDALVYWQEKTGKRATLEAALLGGINTSTEDARAMADFAREIGQGRARPLINLIPWNPAAGLAVEGEPLRTPGAKEAAAFEAALKGFGLNVELRRKKGRGVAGACGQLG
jgi:23S rRNA (adenine2503-C2)-methyltransferase